MGKYIKKYESENDWLNDPDQFRMPGVSWFVEENEIFYLKWYEQNIVVKFIVSGSESVNVELVGIYTRNVPWMAYYYGTILVDGVERTIYEHGPGGGGNPYGSTITFEPGTHIVKYPLKGSPLGVPNQAFSGCDDMTEIILPKDTSSIGSNAFNGCTSLTSITCMANTPPTCGSVNPFASTNNCPIYVPDDSLSAYQSAWSNFTGMALRLKALSEK